MGNFRKRLFKTHLNTVVAWLMRRYFLAIPLEIEEAAEIDSYSKLEVFFKVTISLSMFGIASTALMCFMLTWNEFLLALILPCIR